MTPPTSPAVAAVQGTLDTVFPSRVMGPVFADEAKALHGSLMELNRLHSPAAIQYYVETWYIGAAILAVVVLLGWYGLVMLRAEREKKEAARILKGF